MGKGDVYNVFYCTFWFVFVFEISGGGKGSDEEHITYSGGKEIFDLLQCGWEENKMKDEKERKWWYYKISIKWKNKVK